MSNFQQPKRKLGPGDFKYVNLELYPRDRAFFEKYKEENAGKEWDLLQRLVEDGYKFSSGWDERQNRPNFTITCMNENSPNYTGVMPSHSDTIEEAMWIALYKHYDLLKEEWPIANEGRWG